MKPKRLSDTEIQEAMGIDQPEGAIASYNPDSKDNPNLTDHFTSPSYPYPMRMDTIEYLTTKRALQIGLVKLQNTLVASKQKVLVILEGRDTAGKGGSIRTFMEHLNPRITRNVALSKPTEQERGQWYFQRYVQHLPSAGEIALFDRSWYNRAGVERVMGFCTDDEYWNFVGQVKSFETILVDSGTQVFKLYLSISKQEQANRLREREINPLKRWKLSPIDVEAQRNWDAYTEAKEETFRRTDTKAAPWTIIKADDKLRARLEVMKIVLAGKAYDEPSNQLNLNVDPLLVTTASAIYE